MNKNFVRAKTLQAALFIPRIVYLTINRKGENNFLRENGFILTTDLSPMKLHQFYFKVYPDGTSGF